MAYDIPLSNLTDKTTTADGTGVYDVLMQAVELHIQEQYENDRITGTDYATVYLGALQSAMAESVKFLLSEKNSGLLELQKKKLQEEIDLIIAQTANQYQQIAASKADVQRRNLLNSKDVIHREKETELVIRQESELALNGVEERKLTAANTDSVISGTSNSTNKTNAEVALLNAREDETIAATTRNDTESAQKVLLMEAQTTGFKTDAKQKLLKQLYEGYAINTTTTGELPSTIPTGSIGTALDAVANDILDDLQSTVNI